MEKIVSSKVVYTCPIFKVEEADVELDDGSRTKRWWVVKRDAVAVVCERDGKIIMLREYRSASDSVEWRIPAGGVEPGETPQEAVVREVREEIGLDPRDLVQLEIFKNPSAMIKQSTHCFGATIFEKDIFDPDSKENVQIEIVELSVDEVLDLLSQGEISQSIAKCLRVYLKGRVS